MTTIEDRVQAIEDREEIRELTARYCHAIAAGDAASVVELFCEDGAFTIGNRTVTGTPALLEFYSDVSETPPIPFIQNHVIDELGPTEARARCSAEIRMVRDGEAITAAGWYTDSFRRVGDRWRFQARIFHVFHMVPLSEGWVPKREG